VAIPADWLLFIEIKVFRSGAMFNMMFKVGNMRHYRRRSRVWLPKTFSKRQLFWYL